MTYNDRGYCRYSWKDAVRFLNEGWQEGVQNMDVKIGSIETGEGEAPKASLERDLTGDFFDAGLVLSGEPECWYSITQEPQPREELTVVVNLPYSSGVNQDHVVMRGAVIAKVIDVLRRKYYVKLLMVSYNSYNGKAFYVGSKKFSSIEYSVMVDTQNYYSRSLVAFLVACPAQHRRLFLGMLENETGKNEAGQGYGSPGNTHRRFESALVFPQITTDNEHEYSSIDTARRKVESILKQYEKK